MIHKNSEHSPCPSSLKTSSLFSVSFSFLPLLLFLPPFPEIQNSSITPKINKTMKQRVISDACLTLIG